MAAGERVLHTAIALPSRWRPAGSTATLHPIAPGDAEASVIVQRMRSRAARVQMPPLGSREPDSEGLALIQRWIANDLSHP